MKSITFVLLMLLSLPCYAEWHQKQFEVMGTIAKVEFESNDLELSAKLIQQVVAEMHRIDHLMSPFKTESELSKINNFAGKHPVKVSNEMFKLLKASLYFSELTSGAFDISFSSVGYLYDYRNNKKPTKDQTQSLVEQINYRNIHLSDVDNSVKFDSDKLKIDLGGIAKGHAVDQCIDILIRHGIKNAFVSAGGDSRVIGKKNDRLWYIGIRHPRDEKKLIVNLPLEEVSISTSGDYERFFVQEGIRYHHIIDPKTGDSARESQSVTILAASSTMADALSTSIFVLGSVRGLELINKIPQTSAIIIDNQGKLHYSNDLVSPK